MPCSFLWGHNIHLTFSRLLTVRECLIVEFLVLFPISLEPSVPYQFLIRLRSKRWDSCIGFPSLAFPYGERDGLWSSFDMDCLLALRPLLLLVPLVTCKVWSFDLYLKKLPCNTVYILTKNSIKHLCSTRDLSPCVLLSLSLLSLFLADSLEREGQLCNPGHISLFPSFTLLLTPDHQVPGH